MRHSEGRERREAERDPDSSRDISWDAFVREADELLAIDPDALDAEQVDRLERMSDPFIDLHAETRGYGRTSSRLRDERLAEWLVRQRPTRRLALSDPEIRALTDRIVADLEADRLRVLRPDRAPEPRSLRHSGPVTAVVEEAALWHEAALIDLDVAAGAGRELWDTECEACMPLPARLPRGRHLALRVSGDSMEPLVHDGDAIVVRLGGDVVRDTVIVARDPDHGYVVKRVGAVLARSIQLLSLNPAFPPTRIPRVANAVLGTVVLRWCSHVTLPVRYPPR